MQANLGILSVEFEHWRQEPNVGVFWYYLRGQIIEIGRENFIARRGSVLADCWHQRHSTDTK